MTIVACTLVEDGRGANQNAVFNVRGKNVDLLKGLFYACAIKFRRKQTNGG